MCPKSKDVNISIQKEEAQSHMMWARQDHCHPGPTSVFTFIFQQGAETVASSTPPKCVQMCH